MLFYLIGATLTFTTLFHAFWKDVTTPKTDIASWAVLVVATLLWFITLPRIVQKKLQAARVVNVESWVS